MQMAFFTKTVPSDSLQCHKVLRPTTGMWFPAHGATYRNIVEGASSLRNYATQANILGRVCLTTTELGNEKVCGLIAG